MNTLAGIQRKIVDKNFELTRHAADRMILRHISVAEIVEAIGAGEMIEDYPDDKYGPSCLILGLTNKGRPLHVQCSYSSRILIKIITVYEPDSGEWIEFRLRR